MASRTTVQLSDECRWVLSWTPDGASWHHTAYLKSDGLDRMRAEAARIAVANRGNPDLFMYVRELCVVDTEAALSSLTPASQVPIRWPRAPRL